MAASRHFIGLPMAPVSLPAPKTERFMLSGLGSLVFTEEQRQARALMIAIEKVRPTSAAGVALNIPSYFNNKFPEPQGHWGYWQLMARDFVSVTGPLEYRRQVVYRYDAMWAEIAGRLRCFLEKEHDYRNAVDETILGALGEGGPIPGTPSIDQLKAAWELSLESQLFPTIPETSLWYEIADGWSAQVTLTWQAFAPLNCGIEYQQAPPPSPPGAGQSGPPGERESPPPPLGRASDPLSDNASPPANSVGGPPVPEQSPPPPVGASRTRFVLSAVPVFGPGGTCPTLPAETILADVAGIYTKGDFQVVSPYPPEPGYRCGGKKYYYDISGPGGPLLTGYAEIFSSAPQFSVRYV